MKRTPLSLTLLVSGSLWCPIVHAESVGSTAAGFLTLGVNPRAIAMGEAQVGLADDVYATYWNPAGLGRVQNAELGFVHNELIQEIKSEFAAFAYPIPVLGTLGASMTHLSIGKFDAFDAAGLPVGHVDASDTSIGLSFARAVWQNRRMGGELSAGITAKWIQERLAHTTANALASDVGLLFQPGKCWGELWEGLRMGLALRHLGSPLRFDQESFNLPVSLTAGVSWTGHWLGETLTATTDVEKQKAGKEILGMGVELSSLRLLLLRAGFTTKEDIGTGLRLGIGFRLRTLQIDYAYAGLGGLGQTHRVGFTMRFGITPPDPLVLAQSSYDRGLKAFRRSQYAEALIHFNKTLEIDSSHPEALRMMKETYEQLKTKAAQ